MMKIFVVLKLQEGEIKNAYSLVDSETFAAIPQDIILKTKEVEDRLYSTEELEALRDSMV